MTGIAAGILGLTGLSGLAWFLVAEALFVVLILASLQFQFQPFFVSLPSLALGSLFQGGMSFILFWALSFNMVHIY